MKRSMILSFGIAILFSSVGCCYRPFYCESATGVPCGGQWVTSCYVPVPNPLRVVEAVVKVPCALLSCWCQPGCGWGNNGYGYGYGYDGCCDNGYDYGQGQGCCAPNPAPYPQFPQADGCAAPGAGVMAPHAMLNNPYPSTPYVEAPMGTNTYENGDYAPTENAVPEPVDPAAAEGFPMGANTQPLYYQTGSRMFVAPNTLPPMIPARTLQDARAQTLVTPARL